MSVSVDIEKRLGDFTLETSFSALDCVHGLLGASGCGKSVTLRAIAGIITPDRGHIEVNGRVLFDSEKHINLSPQARKVGLLFQSYALFPNMTVEANLMAAVRGMEKSKAKAAVKEMIHRFSLEGLERLHPRQLSGGQQQRTALARILLTKPEILMLDEPFSALDTYLRWQTELELQQILDDFDGTTLLVTHSREEVHRLCRTVTVLDNGRGVGSMSVQELFDKPETLSACLLSGCKNYSRAEILDQSHVRALDWGVTLNCTAPEGTEFIAVRAHYVKLAASGGENVIRCRVLRVIDDVFSTIVMAATPGGTEGASRLRVELGKDEWHGERGDEILLYIPPEQIMPLRR